MRAAIAIVIFAAGIVQAQTQQPTFEVASVKRNTSGDTSSFFQIPPSGLVNITNATLRMIISQAYQLSVPMDRYTLVVPSNNSLLRGADPIEQRSAPRFDINGKPPDDAASGTQHAMLRTLLEDRFKLRVHREKRDLPVYALTVREGRLGPSLRTSRVDCIEFAAERRKNPGLQPPLAADERPACASPFDSMTSGQMTLDSAGQLRALVAAMQPSVDRPIVDSSGLTGSFEWTLLFRIIPNGADDDVRAAFFTAVQEQLGLKLERSTAPYEVLVIDSVEMPTEN